MIEIHLLGGANVIQVQATYEEYDNISNEALYGFTNYTNSLKIGNFTFNYANILYMEYKKDKTYARD